MLSPTSGAKYSSVPTSDIARFSLPDEARIDDLRRPALMPLAVDGEPLSAGADAGPLLALRKRRLSERITRTLARGTAQRRLQASQGRRVKAARARVRGMGAGHARMRATTARKEAASGCAHRRSIAIGMHGQAAETS